VLEYLKKWRRETFKTIVDRSSRKLKKLGREVLEKGSEKF
jgi:hypothetical protein